MKTLLLFLLFASPAFAQVGISAGVVSTAVAGAPPLPACLLSGYPMNEGSGVTFVDVAGVSNITMPASSLTWTTSHPGFSGVETAAYSGTGTGLFANHTNTNFTGTTPFSVSWWLGVTSGASIVSSINPAASYRGWEISGVVGGTPNLYLVNTLSSNEIQVTGSSTIPTVTTSPDYVVMTYDGSQTAAGVKWYINGSAIGTSTGSNNLSATTASGISSAMMNRVDNSSPSNGVVADLEIYNCVLSSARVSANYALGPGIN